MSEVDVTIVFKKIHDAINAVDENGNRKYKYIINEGSSRSSKTQSIIQTIHQYCSSNVNRRISVWRDTKKDCIATVGYDVKKIFKELPNYPFIKLNKTMHHYEFWTGSIFELNGSDDEDKVIGYQGDVTWCNEPYKIGRDTFDQIDMRTSDFVIIDWNPKKSHWIEDLKKDPRAITIHSTFKDNPFCPPEQKHKILGYQPISMCDVVQKNLIAEADAKKYNIADNPKDFTNKQIKELSRCILNEEKNSASVFNWKVYGLGLKAEKPNRIFSGWNKITKDEFDSLDVSIYYGVDWGQVDPFGIVAAKYYDNTLYLHELNYASENELKQKLTSAELQTINSSDDGIVTYLFNQLDIKKDSYIICDSNRPQKIKLLRMIGYEYAVTAPKGKGSIMDGIDLIKNLNVCYTESSENIEHEYENYQYKTDRLGVLSDEPMDADNHLHDPTRYVVSFLKKQQIINKI